MVLCPKARTTPPPKPRWRARSRASDISFHDKACHVGTAPLRRVPKLSVGAHAHRRCTEWVSGGTARPRSGRLAPVVRALIGQATSRPEPSACRAETTKMRRTIGMSRHCLALAALAFAAIADGGIARAQSPSPPPHSEKLPDGFVVTPPSPTPSPLPPSARDNRRRDSRPDDDPQRQPQPQPPGGCRYQEQDLELIV